MIIIFWGGWGWGWGADRRLLGVPFVCVCVFSELKFFFTVYV